MVFVADGCLVGPCNRFVSDAARGGRSAESDGLPAAPSRGTVTLRPRIALEGIPPRVFRVHRPRRAATGPRGETPGFILQGCRRGPSFGDLSAVILNLFSFAGLRLRIHLADGTAVDGQKWILSRRPAKLNKFRMTSVWRRSREGRSAFPCLRPGTARAVPGATGWGGALRFPVRWRCGLPARLPRHGPASRCGSC